MITRTRAPAIHRGTPVPPYPMPLLRGAQGKNAAPCNHRPLNIIFSSSKGGIHLKNKAGYDYNTQACHPIPKVCTSEPAKPIKSSKIHPDTRSAMDANQSSSSPPSLAHHATATASTKIPTPSPLRPAAWPCANASPCSPATSNKPLRRRTTVPIRKNGRIPPLRES